jgi:hypothetical protein
MLPGDSTSLLATQWVVPFALGHLCIRLAQIAAELACNNV